MAGPHIASVPLAPPKNNNRMIREASHPRVNKFFLSSPFFFFFFFFYISSLSPCSPLSTSTGPLGLRLQTFTIDGLFILLLLFSCVLLYFFDFPDLQTISVFYLFSLTSNTSRQPLTLISPHYFHPISCLIVSCISLPLNTHIFLTLHSLLPSLCTRLNLFTSFFPLLCLNVHHSFLLVLSLFAYL